MVKAIVSGGQTGADEAGLLAAKILGLETKGFMPKGYARDDGKGIEIAQEYGLQESEGGYATRDRQNVAISDAVIGFLLTKPNTGKGTTTALRYALEGNQEYIPFDVLSKSYKSDRKPVLVMYDVSQTNVEESADLIRTFIDTHRPQNLMISGPTANTFPDGTQLFRDVLVKALTVKSS